MLDLQFPAQLRRLMSEAEQVFLGLARVEEVRFRPKRETVEEGG